MPDRIDEGGPESIPRPNISTEDVSPEDKLPPELKFWHKIILWVARAAMVAGVIYIAYFCVQMFWNPDAVPECTCWPYLALAGFLTGLVSDFIIRHKIRVHETRKADRSEIQALLQEAKYAQPRLTDPERSAEFAEKREQIDEEVKRLENEVGPEGWTEFQVLTLDRMLIDFLPLEDLKALARSSLEDLKEYAYGEAFSYDASLYYRWEEKITSAIDDLEKSEGKDESNKDEQSKELRANLRSLLYHVADYHANWAKGSTIVSGIRICGAFAVVVFTLMGILPLLCPTQNSALSCDLRLGAMNWGLLGVAGAIASALISLRNAEEVEVGHTSGRQELWRAVLGAPLGLLAGILVFSALAGGLITSGSAVPNVVEPKFSDAYLSIVWAVVAGMGFENVFQRVRRAVES